MILNNNRDHNSDTDIYTEKTQRCLEYIDSLEEERRKIQVFQRELPLCLDLVSLAIEKCRKEISCGGQSEEYTSRKRPVFEEFIPMKNMSSLSREVEEGDICREKNIPIGNNCSNDKSSLCKSDWLTSVQLWKHAPNQEELAKEVAVQKNGSGGGFQRERSVGSSAKPQQAKASMTAESGGGGDGSCGGNCKRRRSWSPELHRRFVAAVEQLGGVLVATPKKIREIMKVDGLTNNEIKSHLQKYRLHARASTPETQNPCSHVQAVPQFVVLGGLWIPPPEHAPTAAAATTSASGEGAEATSTPPDEIYAPKAARPKPPSA